MSRLRRITDYTFTNFAPGGDATQAVYFGIMWPDSTDELTMPGWSQEVFGSTKHIPGSNRNDTHFTGLGPKTTGYRVWVESRADYLALAALQQQSGVLTLPRNICELDGVEVDRFGVIYVQLVDVALKAVSENVNFLNGSVECTTSWEQANAEEEAA